MRSGSLEKIVPHVFHNKIVPVDPKTEKKENNSADTKTNQVAPEVLAKAHPPLFHINLPSFASLYGRFQTIVDNTPTIASGAGCMGLTFGLDYESGLDLPK